MIAIVDLFAFVLIAIFALGALAIAGSSVAVLIKGFGQQDSFVLEKKTGIDGFTLYKNNDAIASSRTSYIPIGDILTALKLKYDYKEGQ